MTRSPGGSPSVVTLGEALVRLFPPEGQTLEQADIWRVSIAGAEANVAVALARLGVRVAWISKLPRTPLGRKVASTLQGAGVDIRHVVWTETGRLGIYLTEAGLTPDDLRVWYDRAGSTFSTIRPDEVDWKALTGSTLMHFTGITPALGNGPRATVEAALDRAGISGLLVSLDVNYRSQLWPPDEARQTLLELFRGRVNLLICSRKDARVVFEVEVEDDELAVRQLHEEMGADASVLTLGAQGAVAWDGAHLIRVAAYPGRVVDRIGRGDAFAAGVIDGYLAGSLRLGIEEGCALAGLAQARWGDPLWVTREQLSDLLRLGPHDAR